MHKFRIHQRPSRRGATLQNTKIRRSRARWSRYRWPTRAQRERQGTACSNAATHRHRPHATRPRAVVEATIVCHDARLVDAHGVRSSYPVSGPLRKPQLRTPSPTRLQPAAVQIIADCALPRPQGRGWSDYALPSLHVAMCSHRTHHEIPIANPDFGFARCCSARLTGHGATYAAR